MGKKLHILFLNSWYPSRVLPNNGDFIQRHAEAVALKHKVTAIHVISDSNLKNSVEIVDFTLKEVRTLIGYIKPTKCLLNKIFLYFTTYLNLYKKAGNIDLVHLNVIYPAGIFALYLKWFRKKPYIISEHWSIYHEPLFAKINPFVKFTFKIIAKNSKFIAPVTKNLGNSMNKIGLNGNYHPVPNVVNTNIFTPNKINHNEFIILHASNMADVKNVPGILRVIKKLELLSVKFIFYLVGENVCKYDDLIEELQLRQIIKIGHLPHHEFGKLLKKASIFVLFSKSENLPCVILESFSCGVPVISTNVGGIKEYFPKNFGKLINSNEKELYDAILEVKNAFKKASDKEMHNYIIENFSPESICEKFSILYHNSI